MKKLFTILAVAIGLFLCNCTNADVDVPKFEFTEGTESSLSVPSSGGSVVVNFYSPSDWKLILSDEWLSADKCWGEVGAYAITLSANANRNGEHRTGTATITLSNEESFDITISQESEDVFYITSQSEYYIGVSGGEIEVKVSTNIEYTVSIPSSAQSWLKLDGTRALRNETLRFTVSKNTTYDTREAIVKLLDENQRIIESFTVTQTCEEVFDSNAKNEYSIGFGGGNIGIVVVTNKDYTVRIPSSAQSWIKLDNTRAYRQEQVNFVVSKNSGHDARQAKIELVGKDNSVLLSFTITQSCQDIFNTDVKEEYTVDARGGEVGVAVATNIEYSVKIPMEAESWIKLSDTRAYRQEQVTFVVSENEGKERQAKIELLDSTSKALQSFTIKQLTGHKFDIDGKNEYTLESAGGTVEIDIQTNFEYTVEIPTEAQSWLQLADTRALRNEKLTFTISANTEKVARSAQVTLKDTDNQPLATILFKQKALVIYDNSKEEGLYLGIQGFNIGLFYHPLQHLSNKSINTYSSFIDDLSMGNGTLLYYAVDKSIDYLQENNYPSNLYNVAIVTFTDGLDATSLGPKYGNNFIYDSEYISKLGTRLNYETVSDKKIESYTIGVLGEDAETAKELFDLNMSSLATSSDKVFNVSNMSEVNTAFYEIAKNLGETNTFYKITLTEVMHPNHGQKARFTFDNVTSYDSSRKYIEGICNIDTSNWTITLENVEYVGMTSSSGSIITFVEDGDMYKLIFDDLQCNDGEPIVEDNVKYWWTKQDVWIQNSEFVSGKNTDLERIQRTAAIMLNLDCSSSLKTEGFNVLKSAAKAFVATLLEYATDPNEVASVSLNKTSVTLGVGNTTTLKATVLPTTASLKDVIWSSSNPTVASVSQSGVVTANAEGTATITVTTRDGGYTATCKVTVIENIPNNEIRYTSSDGKVVTPYSTTVFGANIVSNVYKDGKGVITFDGPVTSIGNRAFYYCSGLTSVTIPNSVTSIGTYAFCCCCLTSVTIPNSVTSIGVNPFLDCYKLNSFNGKFATTDGRCLIADGVLKSFAPAGLTNYTIPNSVTSIGEWAFGYFDGLTSVTIPNSVTSIGYAAFNECTSLTSVTIPDSVTSIGDYAFKDCSSLTSVYCKPTTPPTGGSTMFSYYDSGGYKPIGCKIYVPRNSVDSYKSAEYWSSYKSYIVGHNF